MIDVADSNALYYYHYNALGSVVALSDSYGNSCQSYEYSAYGQVAASDPNFIANPYMFTGRRFDYETGLYYYRARYYNPYIGRFLQTDPIGYGDGINWYAYCGNNPVGRVDPSGTHDYEYHHSHFEIPYELIESQGWSMEDIPGKLMEWLGDMAVSDELPVHWELGGVDWKDGSDELLDLFIWYNNGYASEWVCGDEPVLAIETVGGVKVLTVEGIGILDDIILNDIIESSVHGVNQWWKTPSWKANLVINHWELQYACDTPFFTLSEPRFWKYNGGKNLWSSGDINYILEGHAMAYLGIPSEWAWFIVCKWKEIKYDKDPIVGTWYWFNKGYTGYGSRKDW